MLRSVNFNYLFNKMIITEAKYRFWQKQLAEKKFYRIFWGWWGLYSVLIFIFAGAILFFFPGFRLADLFALFAFLLVRFVFCELTHLLYKKPHPYQKYNFQPLSTWLMSLPDKRLDAFPSEHISCMVVISTIFYLFNPLLGLFFFAIAIFTSIARIVLGYHDLYDIAGGWILGSLAGIIFMNWVLSQALYPALFELV